MMGWGSEGCSTEEKPCPISRVSQQQQQERREQVSCSSNPPRIGNEINFYNQAQKALCELCPFDSEEGVVVVSRVSTLPVGLSDYLLKYSHGHKRHKRSHLESGAKAKTSGSGHSSRPRARNVWTDTEDYFRPVVLTDIEKLEAKSTSLCTLGTDNCFCIPPLRENVTNVCACEKLTAPNVDVVVGIDSGVAVVKETEKKDENERQAMEIDPIGDVSGVPKVTESLSSSLPLSLSDMPWLSGVRNKLFLTSERPSKKRKLLGSDAGLEKLRIVYPLEGECHLCSLGDLGHTSNKLLICSKCKVAVHQKCYGVVDVPEGLWLCSWCSDHSQLLSTVTPCLLCPKQGGALKPVANDVSESTESKNVGVGVGVVKFAHLFCSQWMPEVYVEDTRTMEPIMNVQGIKEARRKLVCYLCKVKCGAGVRCSHGTCRTSFHPSCAREAKHRMEIWGKLGCDNVELRAFCLKHSEAQDISSSQQSKNHLSVAADHDFSASKTFPVALVVHKPLKLKLGRKNEDRNGVSVLSDSNSVKLGTPKESNGVTNTPDPIDSIQTLKKLVDRGKAIVSDVASDIGITSDLLAATLAGDSPDPDLRCKIICWLRTHVFMGTAQQSLKNISKSGVPLKETGLEDPNSVPVESCADLDALSVKSVQLKKPTNNIRILKDNKATCMAKQQNDNGILLDDSNLSPHTPNGDLKEDFSDVSLLRDGDLCSHNKHASEKVFPEPSECRESCSAAEQSTLSEAEHANVNTSENDQTEEVDVFAKSAFTDSTTEHPISSIDVTTPAMPDIIGEKSSSSLFIHPIIHKRLLELQNGKQENIIPKSYSPEEKGMTCVKAPLPPSVCSNHQDPHTLPCIDTNHTADPIKLEQLVKARNMGILELSPEDEVEGQLVYFQKKLLDHAVASKHYSDELMFRVIRTLPQELDIARKRRWDSVLVNQYLSGLREEKKQGRKEKRHKEAQAVLAAATAAAASSSRLSSLRKDAHDEDAHENYLKVNASGGRIGLMPRAKETLSKLAGTTISTQKHSDGLLEEHPQLCDICRRPETVLNPIIICCICKVVVHLGCYRSVKHPTGPWYCELCEEFLPSTSPRAPPINYHEMARSVAQCGLCSGTTGAFRKSTGDQWVHPFCAEWMLELTFRRGQPNLVEGMEAMTREREVFCIFCRNSGICVKCNYGNCQSTFHPMCARDAGIYMHVKTGGGKLQHKAYCEKHSLEQREKVESQQHGAEDLKRIKQLRVELERVRLLCERIIRREKVKRELVLCSHDILASKRDSVALSVLVNSPLILPDISSESATTTSLRGHFDDNKSCSEAIQRSDDITVDSAISGKRRPIPMDIDQKTDDSSTTQHPSWSTNPTHREPCSGKQLLHRPLSDSRDLPEDATARSKSRKHMETFSKELVMTSDQASLKNQRLPKGFAYVPVAQPNENPASHETGRLEPDG
ncbi:hypothetical protein GIB67_017858 [Kingdonia uniflora]|uniref:Uncharacterized protein n=1 Tax=Kingdonia uniflora TaxID=39325 RepID=A0A7J7MKU1_9MAGN|nr:hypothetical protein GIB67_017858 [Kingdonia uniflora]